jgi:hypothetical protein
MTATDLLGDPVMQRDATFLRPGVRLTLSRRWGPGPRALVIGCNPSDADALKDDPTSKWWNRWFQHYGFGAYDAVNVFPFCSPSPAVCRSKVRGAMSCEWHDRDALHSNIGHVARLAKAADQVFVCFGNIANDIDADWVEHVLEHIQTGEETWPDLWCWGTTASGAPIHPMARGKHRIDPLQAHVLWRAGR